MCPTCHVFGIGRYPFSGRYIDSRGIHDIKYIAGDYFVLGEIIIIETGCHD